MIRFVIEEIYAIIQFLKRNSSEAIIIFSATLFFTLDKYHMIWNEWLSSFIYYAALPVLVILIILRKNPLDFGLRLGIPRVWGIYVFITCLASALILYACSFIPALQSYYQINEFNLPSYFLTSAITLSASEFMFRGFLLLLPPPLLALAERTQQVVTLFTAV